MDAPFDLARLDAAYCTALDALMKERHPDGYWVGELSSSALSTATAVMALHLCTPVGSREDGAELARSARTTLIERGLAWLVQNQNPDGGWGDTDRSFSNISTTMLCRAAFYLVRSASVAYGSGAYVECVTKAEAWLFERYGHTPEQLAEAVRQRYGKDRTFATPILTTCALAGLVDWREVPPLPFELACFPQSWFRFLRLHVVSYALPALIAIGQCIYHHKKPWNPITRLARAFSRKRSLRVLRRIQPSSGGFLEATPLTSFVTLSLAACGLAEHVVAKNGVRFLVNSVRPDGSWPIDTNLSTWVTTLAINALAAAGELKNIERRGELNHWLNQQQYREVHPYTGAAPGGWAWTPLPGGVPDADDTPGALLALWHIHESGLGAGHATRQGIDWLLALQNNDGGWPTFCRGWGALPFDRSGADLTAHALRVIAAYQEWLREPTPELLKLLDQPGLDDLKPWIQWARQQSGRVEAAQRRGLAFLVRRQRSDGSWLPLWFGNQHMPDDDNPTYGTARVLAAYRDLGLMHEEPARRGIAWLLAHQNNDGGWGGGRGSPSSIEETALAVEILADALSAGQDTDLGRVADGPDCNPVAWRTTLARGMNWLCDHVERGDLHNPTPIGFYFAKLWYYEKLYPIIFALAALGRARIVLAR